MAATNGGGRAELRAVGRDLQVPAAAGIAGLVFAVLFVVSVLLLYKQPASGSTAHEITAWYLANHSKNLAVVGVNAKQDPASALEQYVHAGSRVLEGLVTRRKSEAALFANGESADGDPPLPP